MRDKNTEKAALRRLNDAGMATLVPRGLETRLLVRGLAREVTAEVVIETQGPIATKALLLVLAREVTAEVVIET